MSATSEKVAPLTRPARAKAGLRPSEKLVLGFLAYGVAASMVYSLAGSQRLAIGILNALAALIVVLISRSFEAAGESAHRRSEGLRSSRLAATLTALRDWLPCFVILLAYRESSLFCSRAASGALDALFERWDRALVGNGLEMSALAAVSPWLGRYLEFAYLLCYPMVPLGFAVVYFSSRRTAAEPAARVPPGQAGLEFDRFWTGVLLALFTCYALYPLFPLTTPRLLAKDFYHPDSQFVLRRLNLWLLGQYASSAGVFPSGHVAGVTAIALSVRERRHRWGVIFTAAAESIAAATVIERYHYLADALAGALIAFGAFRISNRIHSGKN